MCVLEAWLKDWRSKVNRLYHLAAVIDSETKEEHNLNYKLICEWIQKKFGGRNLHAVPNKEVRLFKKLTPLFTSESIFPDVAIYTEKADDENDEMPLLLIQVNSRPYHRTLKKMVFVLVEHLRWLRNYDSDIVEWSGFCFPKHEVPTCVSRMDVSWDYQHLGFVINYSTLELNEVVDDIGRTIDKHLRMVRTFRPPQYLFSIPLSGMELLSVFGQGAFQLHSNRSIIVAHENKVYKYIIDSSESSLSLSLLWLYLQKPELRDEQCQCQLPTGLCIFSNKCFLVFPMLVWPMTTKEALHCLPEFVDSVAKVIESVHQDPLKRAHLDIRLENVCFRPFGTANTG